MERSFEAWEEVQRHGLDLADRLAQGFADLIHTHVPPSPPFSWPSPPKSPFFIDLATAAPNGADFLPGSASIFGIGGRLGQAGAELGACINGVVQQFFRQLPVPFRPEDSAFAAPSSSTSPSTEARSWDASTQLTDLGFSVGRFSKRADVDAAAVSFESEFDEDDEDLGVPSGLFTRPRGTVNFTATYDSRNQTMEGSLVTRGDLWRIEASSSSAGSTSRNESTSPLFLVQLGPVLFVRDSTLLLPVHLSKQHLLWYGYDRKNGMHSICPALWSKHRRWLLMSMICLNPLACSFMDLQFPNGQLTYVAGEGFTSSAFIPLFGGLLQAQGRYPGETKISFSCKNKGGTRFTPMLQLPDKSFSLGISQAVAWKRSGLMMRPQMQFSVCPTFGGSDPGVRAELIHTLKEEVNVIYGLSCSRRPSVFTYLSLGRSKWNGHGSSGVVASVEAPLDNLQTPYFSVQLNGGFEF